MYLKIELILNCLTIINRLLRMFNLLFKFYFLILIIIQILNFDILVNLEIIC